MKTRQQAAKRVQGRPNRGSRSRPTASTTEGTEGLGRGTRRAADLNRLRRDDPSFARRRRVDDTGGEAEQTRSQGVRARDEGGRGEEQRSRTFHGHALPRHKQSQNKEPCAKTAC